MRMSKDEGRVRKGWAGMREAKKCKFRSAVRVDARTTLLVLVSRQIYALAASLAVHV